MHVFKQDSRNTKSIAWTLLLIWVVQIVTPTVVFAGGGGPTQPEVQGFTPVGVSDMVDPFTGDFTYNIPLMNIDGYPVNIAYNSGVSMDQEASWVGLGWNLNMGAIVRSMRGLPDDFNGDKIIWGLIFNITWKFLQIPYQRCFQILTKIQYQKG
jgi:hypothetical protein